MRTYYRVPVIHTSVLHWPLIQDQFSPYYLHSICRLNYQHVNRTTWQQNMSKIERYRQIPVISKFNQDNSTDSAEANSETHAQMRIKV